MQPTPPVEYPPFQVPEPAARKHAQAAGRKSWLKKPGAILLFPVWFFALLSIFAGALVIVATHGTGQGTYSIHGREVDLAVAFKYAISIALVFIGTPSVISATLATVGILQGDRFDHWIGLRK